MQNFAPGDYLGHLPASYEPNFEVRAPAPTAARLAAAGTRPSHAARPPSPAGPPAAASGVDASVRRAADAVDRHLQICVGRAEPGQAGRPDGVAARRRECRGTAGAPGDAVRPLTPHAAASAARHGAHIAAPLAAQADEPRAAAEARREHVARPPQLARRGQLGAGGGARRAGRPDRGDQSEAQGGAGARATARSRTPDEGASTPGLYLLRVLPPTGATPLPQMEVAPHLARLESEWVGAIKKNLEIDGQCMRLESECAALEQRLGANGSH